VRLVHLLLSALPLLAQPLRVYSEFARIDPSGQVAAPAEPREILSPALARNAFTSFQIVVQVGQGTHYRLYIGQNPENAVRIALYRESGDRLEPVAVPYDGDGTRIFWMDVWTAADAPVRRTKIEPQLSVDNDWVIYPMEARVVEAEVPEHKPLTGSALPIEVMRSYLCGNPGRPAASDPLSAASLHFRNAQQDVALAAKASKEELRRLFGRCDAAPPHNPEWYLAIRDYLFRLR
jgi:hypothetical protein